MSPTMDGATLLMARVSFSKQEKPTCCFTRRNKSLTPWGRHVPRPSRTRHDPRSPNKTKHLRSSQVDMQDMIIIPFLVGKG